MEEVKAANQRLAAQIEQVSSCRAANEAALEQSSEAILRLEAKCLQVTRSATCRFRTGFNVVRIVRDKGMGGDGGAGPAARVGEEFGSREGQTRERNRELACSRAAGDCALPET